MPWEQKEIGEIKPMKNHLMIQMIQFALPIVLLAIYKKLLEALMIIYFHFLIL